jgi:predicted DNA-binding transcriptional regulator YafY
MQLVSDPERPVQLPGAVRPKRLLKLESLLQGGHVWSPKRLAELFGVCTRTIYRDIQLLRDADIPIQFDPLHGGYRLIRIEDEPRLNADELVALLLAVRHAQLLPDLIARTCDTAVRKVLLSTPSEARNEALRILENHLFQIRQGDRDDMQRRQYG